MDGRATDRVTERFGFRDFRFDGNGFRLNGAPIRLRGVGKHQETEAHLCAVTDDELRQEWAWIKDLGVNFVRLAHYPHAAWSTTWPTRRASWCGRRTGTPTSARSRRRATRSRARWSCRDYNHPSIVFWSVGNETGFLRVNRYAAVVKATDPHRIVAYASNVGTKGKRFYPDLDLIARRTPTGAGTSASPGSSRRRPSPCASSPRTAAAP